VWSAPQYGNSPPWPSHGTQSGSISSRLNTAFSVERLGNGFAQAAAEAVAEASAEPVTFTGLVLIAGWMIVVGFGAERVNGVASARFIIERKPEAANEGLIMGVG
jgi:hypothetical protein